MAAEPGLADFQLMLNDLLELRPHRLDAETERVLASLGEVLNAPYMIYSRSKSGDMQFAPFSDAAGTIYENSFNGFESNFETHSDTHVRRGAWASFSAGLKVYKQTYAATFATEVNKNIAMARLRKYRNTEEFLLQPHKIPLCGLPQHPRHHPGRAGPAHAALRPAAPPGAGAGQAAVLRHQGSARPGVQSAACRTRTAAG